MKKIIIVIAGLIVCFGGVVGYAQEKAVEVKSGEIDWVRKYEDAFNRRNFQGMLEAGSYIMKEEISNSALDRLLEIAKDKTKATEGDIQFRCMTIEILGCLKVKNERVFDELKNIAEDKDELMTIRLFSIQQMGGANKNEKIFDYLISKLNEPNSDIREAVISRLGEPGNIKAGSHLMPLLNDKNKKIKGAAITALGTIGYKEATEEIIANLYDDEFMGASLFALQKMPDERAIKPLIALLLNKERQDRDLVVRRVTKALANFKDERVVDALIKVVNDGGFSSIAAAEALGELGNKKAIESIKLAIGKETDSFAIEKYKDAYKKITGENYVE